jgi:tetratricopeptide (TPR) repeat protein
VADRPDDDTTRTNVSPVPLTDKVEDADLRPAFDVGVVLADRYQIDRFIARGGMGEVYRVYDRELGETVALKTIIPRSAGDSVSIDRFRREIQTARMVSHRNVCRIFDIGRHIKPDGGEVVFLTMEMLEGETMRARLRREVFTADEALDVVEQLVAGLGAAHDRGIVHRDLKPSNIFLVPDGERTRVVIADFGLARPELKEAGQLTVTGTGEILGTPAYMSPEQLEGKPATTASDIYALGLVMYEMLTGAQAFEGESAFQIAINKLRDAPTSPSVHSSDIPPRWNRTILTCLQKEPGRRFARAAEIPAVLSGQRRPPRTPLAAWPAPLRYGLFASGALLVVAAAVLGITGRWPFGAGDAVEIRRSVAVLGFENITGDPETAWISTALGEYLTTELAAGGAVRAVPSESVAMARNALGIDSYSTLGADNLNRLRGLIAVDLVVLGSYTPLGDDDAGSLRIDARVQDVVAGETTILQPITGTRAELGELAVSAANQIRGRIGLDPAAESTGVRSGLPRDPDAARLYAEGVSLLRSFQPQAARLQLERAAEAAPGSAMVWIQLANAWSDLGFGGRAAVAAERAVQQAAGLDREIGLRIEGRQQMIAGRWSAAAETLDSLWTVYPDNPEYGIGLADAQVGAQRAHDALATVDQLRGLPPPLNRDPRIDLAEAAAAEAAGDFPRQETAARQAVEAGRRLGSALLEARGRLALGSALRSTGQIDQAMTEIEEARRLMEAEGDLYGVANAHYALALAHASRGSVADALAAVDASLAMARRVGSRVTEADSLNLLGSIQVHQGELVEAQDSFRRAYELQGEIGNPSGAADALNNLATVQMWAGDFPAAVDSFRQALTRFRSLGMAGREAAVVANLARVEAARGDLEGARRYFEEAAGLYRVQEIPEGLAESLFGLGEVLLSQGDVASARTRHEEALRIRRGLGHPAVAESEFALAGIGLAEADLGLRDLDGVVDELGRTVEALAEQQRLALEADALNYLAEAQLKDGRLADGEASLNRLEELEAASNPMTLLAMRVNHARVLGLRGDLAGGEAVVAEVLEAARGQSNTAMEFEAELARADLLAAAGRSDDAQKLLGDVQRRASSRGWLLVANRAAAAENRLTGP